MTGKKAQYEHITIQAKTLDEVYGARPQSEWPCFVLMDTEGHEQMVIDGSKQMWSQGWRPMIMTEFAPQMMNLRGECHYHQDLVNQYGYQVYVLVVPKAGQHAPATLKPVTLEYLEKIYPELASEESNPQEAYLNLIFLPPQLQIKNGSLQQANESTAK